MLKVKFTYGGYLSVNNPNKALEITMWDNEKSEDGTHIAASSFVGLNLMNRLSKKNIESLLVSLERSIEACIEDVISRMELQKSDKMNQKKKDD